MQSALPVSPNVTKQAPPTTRRCMNFHHNPTPFPVQIINNYKQIFPTRLK
jgi:hypothetical protein